MKGEQKARAAKSMIQGLYECGYISEIRKKGMEHLLDNGNREVLEEIRLLLIKFADAIVK